MLQVLLDRWQFGVTTVYHFLFVPLTIGLIFLIAVMESIYVASGNEDYKKMAKFWGNLFLINFAVGVVTGIMQEFQFGMNWSNYSRFVGDVFGAPLAVEALAAFFLESTFLGIWVFGWDRVSKRVHLTAVWMVAFGTTLSAFWILAANAFMQEPVGYVLRHGRAEMDSFGALLINPQLWVEFPHVWFAALSTATFFVAGISAYYILRGRSKKIFMNSFKIAVSFGLVGSVLVAVVGHEQAQHLVTAQPMKMAASEALWNTSAEHASWNLLAGIDQASHRNTFQVQVPYALSILAYNHPYGKVEGINQLQAQYVQKYGPGNYIPPVWITFYTFRIMVLAGVVMILLALYGVYLMLRDKLEGHRKYYKWMIWAIALPYIGNTTGWIMTEIGRQPWAVFGLLKTANGDSPTVGPALVWTTLIGFALVYGILAVVDVYLLVKNIKMGPDGEDLAHRRALEDGVGAVI
ncbi:cytochrome ubiquinol oxidase subunit I [Alicyclobacillaceae bacterium I2511]|nr:cytochrome ubiquinol oxidase subunit I [Alicyclobacillaceae bacterium I2511]